MKFEFKNSVSVKGHGKTMRDMNTKESLGGIKQSQKLILLNQRLELNGSDDVMPLYRLLGMRKINIEFLTITPSGRESVLTCCVNSNAVDQIMRMINADEQLKSRVVFAPSVGSVSLFPHRFRLKALELVYSAFDAMKVPLYGMTTTISSMTFIIDYTWCNKAQSRIESLFDIPGRQKGFQNRDMQAEPDGLMAMLTKSLETAATYHEHRIKTYGVKIHPDLNLMTFNIPLDRRSKLIGVIQAMAEMGANFHFILSTWADSNRLWFYFVLDRIWENRIKQYVSGNFDEAAGEIMNVLPVELIHFQGPHFGDRYGVADRTLTSLREGGVWPVLSGCSGASMYLVFPESKAAKAKESLLNVLEEA